MIPGETIYNDEMTRSALVYHVVKTDPPVYRTRVHKHPDDGEPGWLGGKVLWGHDKADREEAMAIARAWVEKGELPA